MDLFRVSTRISYLFRASVRIFRAYSRQKSPFQALFGFALTLESTQRGGIRKNATSVLDPAEDAQPQEIEVRPAEDDAFLQFQAVHLCFYLTLTPL